MLYHIITYMSRHHQLDTITYLSSFCHIIGHIITRYAIRDFQSKKVARICGKAHIKTTEKK